MSSLEELRAQGNRAYKAARYEQALELYSQCVGICGNSDATLLTTRANTLIKLDRFTEALSDASAAIAIDPTWQKGHYFRAKALAHLRDYAAAVLALQVSNAMLANLYFFPS